MKRTIFIFTLLFIATLIQSCTKNDTEEKDQTITAPQTGSGLFTCIYDGKTISIKGATAAFHWQQPDNMLIIQIEAQADTNVNPQKFYLSFHDIDNAGIYPFRIKDPNNSNSFKWGNSYMSTTIVGKKEWIYRGSSGAIEITKFDTINHIISGNFKTDMVQIWLMNSSGDKEPKPTNLKDTLLVSSGLFDLQL
jgi:hypothetical protein